VIGKTIMRLFNYFLMLFRNFLLVTLLFYWATFIGYTIAKYIEGGPNKVAAYYWTDYVTCMNNIEPCPMSWGAFWRDQGGILAITLLLCFFEWRSWRSRTPANSV
jgi:hypothetical protein